MSISTPSSIASLAPMNERQEQWESRYAAVDRLWSEQPNDWLPEFAASWEPGRALDLVRSKSVV